MSSSSLQLLFAFAEDNISVKDIKLSEAKPLQSEEFSEHSFWFEVHDQYGDTVYRRSTNNPLTMDTEQTAPTNMSQNRQPYGQFTIHVPVVHNGTIKLFGSVDDQSPVQTLGEFPL